LGVLINVKDLPKLYKYILEWHLLKWNLTSKKILGPSISRRVLPQLHGLSHAFQRPGDPNKLRAMGGIPLE
jgi:hypothetical protein